MIEICRFSSPEDIAADAARRAAIALKQSQKENGDVTFVVAGGRLPPVAYGLLQSKYGQDFDWTKILFLIGDERCVPLDNPDSSWLSIMPMLNAHPEIPVNHIMRPPSDEPAEQAAKAYQETLVKLKKNEQGDPLFNLFWFGIGEDGHTLSLFPNHPSTLTPTEELVIPVHDSPKPPPNRISFTFKALRGVESAVAFISGSSKAAVVARIAGGDQTLPFVRASQEIDKAGGHVTWLVDNEAMSLVPKGQALVV